MAGLSGILPLAVAHHIAQPPPPTGVLMVWKAFATFGNMVDMATAASGAPCAAYPNGFDAPT